MKEKIIYQRDYSAQRAQEEEALRNFVPSKEETEQDKKAYARFKKSLEAAYFERDPECEKTAMRMVKKAIMLANNFLWDITVKQYSTSLEITLVPTYLINLSMVKELVSLADPFAIDASDPKQIKLVFTFITHRLVIPKEQFN